MSEIDNCPICNTPCEVEYGFEKGAYEEGLEEEGLEIVYATCKTCGTKWRRREEYLGKSKRKAVYEKWAYRIPEINLPIPLIGTIFKIGPRWGKWMGVKEKLIPVTSLEFPLESARFREEISQTIRNEVAKLRIIRETEQSPIFTNKEFIVPQSDARSLALDIDVSGKNNVKIIGDFTASGGQNNDIKFFAFNEHNFRKALRNLPTQTIDESGKVSNYHFEIPISHSGKYYFVFDNKFSMFSPKTIRITTIESYEVSKFGFRNKN